MRDFLLKEVAAYNYYSKVPTLFTPSFSTQRPPKSSIFALSESFVNALQADYSHTVHTLLKSEEKLSAPEYIAFNCAVSIYFIYVFVYFITKSLWLINVRFAEVL